MRMLRCDLEAMAGWQSGIAHRVLKWQFLKELAFGGVFTPAPGNITIAGLRDALKQVHRNGVRSHGLP